MASHRDGLWVKFGWNCRRSANEASERLIWRACLSAEDCRRNRTTSHSIPAHKLITKPISTRSVSGMESTSFTRPIYAHKASVQLKFLERRPPARRKTDLDI